MFIIDATFEDCRIQATPIDNAQVGTNWQVCFTDGLTSDNKTIEMTSEHLIMVLAFNLDPNGKPKGFEQYYKELEPIFKDWPNTLRPIP